MTSSPSVETIRLEVRRLAAAGSWPAVAAMLAPLATDALRDGELALLYAESQMRGGLEREAISWLTAILDRLSDDGDRVSLRRARNMLGVAYIAVGKLEQASVVLGEALELATEADDALMLAQASNNLGAIANQRGDHELALWQYRIALPNLQRLGDKRRIAESYHNIAITCRDLGELEEADEHERRAIDYATDAPAPRVAAMGRIGRAEIALRRGDARLAETTARLAADELEGLGDLWNEADAHRVVGVAAGAQGKVDEALAAFDRALRIATDRGHTLNEADVLRDRATLQLKRGEQAAGTRDALRAIELYSALGATTEVAVLERRLASLS